MVQWLDFAEPMVFALLQRLLDTLAPHALAYAITGVGVGVGGGSGASGLSDFLFGTIVSALQSNFVGITALMLFLYSASMVIFSQQESTITETRMAYVYAMIGCAVTGLASLIARGFAPGSSGGALADTSPLTGGIQNVLRYFFEALGTLFVVNVVIQAFRLVSSLGGQETSERARKRLVAGFVGVGIVLLANAIVTTVITGDTSIVASELIGLVNFLLTFIGAAAFIAVIVAGMALVLSVSESLKDTAKQIIKTCVIVLLIVILSLGFLKIFFAFTPTNA